MKRYLKIFITLLLLYIPSVVYGDELSNFRLEVKSTNLIVDNVGDESTLKVSLVTTNVDSSITQCSFRVNTSSNAQLVSFSGVSGNGWSDTANGQEYVLTSETGIKTTSAETEASVTIGNAVVRVNGEATFTLSNMTCTSDSGTSGSISDVSVTLGVTADDISVKIDGSNATGDLYTISPSTKENFILSITSRNADTLSNVTVKAKNTLSGEKLLCDSSSISNCAINFTNDNFCVSGDSCIGVRSSEGDVVLVSITQGDTVLREIYVTRQLSEDGSDFFTDSSLSYLNVYGNEIELVEGQNRYEIVVYGEKEEYSVMATLSDPDHYQWAEEDNPTKYNFRTDYILLRVVPKDRSMLGANDRNYEIVVLFQDDSSSSSQAAPSSSVKPSSSRQTNPQTGGIASFIVAIILFASLIYSLRTYNKTMGQ